MFKLSDARAPFLEFLLVTSENRFLILIILIAKIEVPLLNLFSLVFRGFLLSRVSCESAKQTTGVTRVIIIACIGDQHNIFAFSEVTAADVSVTFAIGGGGQLFWILFYSVEQTTDPPY